MTRHIVAFDLETAGPGDPDPDVDRIVEFSILEDPWRGDSEPWTKLVDPGEPIPEQRTEVHGISDEDVADAWPFEHYAEAVQATVEDAVLVGFGSRGYDVPILNRELRRAGQDGLRRSDSGFITHPEIDLRVAWQELEPRSLEGAARRFAGRSLGEDAHSAEADTVVLPEVLMGMVRAFNLPDPTQVADPAGNEAPEEVVRELVEICAADGAMDRAGCFRRLEDGTPAFDFGKHRGEPVREHPDYLEWMCRKDFAEETKRLARHFLTPARK